MAVYGFLELTKTIMAQSTKKDRSRREEPNCSGEVIFQMMPKTTQLLSLSVKKGVKTGVLWVSILES